jgi:hypothetical protein
LISLSQNSSYSLEMFHQTIFYPSRSAGNTTGFVTTSAAPSKATSTPVSAASPEKASSSFMDIRKQYFRENNQNHHHQRFWLGSSSSTPTRTVAPTRSIGSDYRDAVFAHSSTPAKEPTITSVPHQRFGSVPLNPLGLQPTSPLFASPAKHCSNIFMDDQTKWPCGQKNENACSRTRVDSDADTATTASITTSVSSPTPSFLSNSSSLDRGGEAETVTIEFLLDNNNNASPPNWIIQPGNRESEQENTNVIDTHCEEYKETLTRMANFREEESDHEHAYECEYEYEGFGEIDEDEEDICSCCTPVLKNTSRPQHVIQQQQQQAFVSGSTMTTTTTETKTTTTITTQTATASSMSTSESMSSTTVPRTIGNNEIMISRNLFSEISEGQQSDLSAIGPIQKKSMVNNAAAVVPLPNLNKEMSSAIATAPWTTTALTEQLPCCKSCASKERLIAQQRKDLGQMKGMLKKLCLLLADTLRSKENNGNGDGSNCIASDSRTPKPKAIVDRPRNEIVSKSPSSRKISRAVASDKNDEGDSSSVTTSATAITNSTSSSSLASSTSSSTPTSSPRSRSSLPPLPRRRIISLPVTRVGRDCPRTSNQRIQVSGKWGTYSGPTLRGKEEKKSKSQSQNESQSQYHDESTPDAGILQGCVVRLDDSSLYVGSMSRNDTGSFIFHPPGTLYDPNGKPMRRIR